MAQRNWTVTIKWSGHDYQTGGVITKSATKNVQAQNVILAIDYARMAYNLELAQVTDVTVTEQNVT